MGKRLNKLQDILKDTTSEERRRALENMQAMKPASSPLEKELAAYLKEMHDYMVDRGVKRFDTKLKKWVALGNVKDYFPRVWDKNTSATTRPSLSRCWSSTLVRRRLVSRSTLW